MYTIKSVSKEGTYYLVNHWNKYKTFWIEPEKIKSGMLFKTQANAKASLSKLLKVMEDYKTDKFTLIEIKEVEK